MFTYQINIEYLGTNFVGWQIQKNVFQFKRFWKKLYQVFKR